jgi:ribonucleotide reductase alpha subunit
MATRYADYFPLYVKTGIKAELLDADLARYDLKKLAAAIKPERDLAFQFLGLQTLYDRYFLHAKGNRIELPQAFFMRVAMGLAIREIDREARAIARCNPVSPVPLRRRSQGSILRFGICTRVAATWRCGRCWAVAETGSGSMPAALIRRVRGRWRKPP